MLKKDYLEVVVTKRICPFFIPQKNKIDQKIIKKD